MAIIYGSAPGTGSGGLGTSPSPYTGFFEAISALMAEAPGSTLRLKVGEYTQGCSWNTVTWASGTPSNRYYIEPESYTPANVYGPPGGTTSVIIKPSSGQAINMTLPVLGAQYISFRGLVFDGTNVVDDGTAVIAMNYLHKNIEFRNCTMKNHGRQNVLNGIGVRRKVSAMDFGVTNNSGILMNNQVRWCLFDYDSTLAGLGCEHYIYCHASGNTFENNRFTSQTANQPDIAIQFFATNTSVIDSNLVRFNQFDNLGNGHSSDAVVLFSERCNNNKVYSNVFYDCNRRTIDFRGGSGITGPTNDNEVVYNTIVNCDVGVIVNSPGFSNTKIKNNIIYQCNTALTDLGTGTIKTHNSIDGTNPLFNNQGAKDFTLTISSPSSLRIGGSPAGSPQDDSDFVGAIRSPSTPSMGAYEYGTPASPGSPSNVYPNPGGYTIPALAPTVLPGLSVAHDPLLVNECWLSLEGTGVVFSDIDTSGGATSVTAP